MRVLFTQHCDSISTPDLREAVMEEIIKPVLPSEWLNKETSTSSTQPVVSLSVVQWVTVV